MGAALAASSTFYDLHVLRPASSIQEKKFCGQKNARAMQEHNSGGFNENPSTNPRADRIGL
jgi:hypothetical protein